MLRKIGLTMLCATALLSTNAFSVTEHTFNIASTYEFTLPSNEPQVFTNIFFYSIDATCTIISDAQDNPFNFTILRKSGSLNGIPLSTGSTMDLIVHPGDKLHITAVSGGRMELTNHGENTMKASCISSK